MEARERGDRVNDGIDAPLCSVLTAPAPSGIAVILLKGRGAESILARAFRRPHRKPLPPKDRAAYGLIVHQGKTLDEVVVVRTAAPPGECFEICCHGGTSSARALTGLLEEMGARQVPWSQLVVPRTLEYELLEAILAAEGETQAAKLAHLQGGVLRTALAALAGFLEKGSRDRPVERECGPFRALLDTYASGRFLAAPPLVLVTGAANAGKSTLFNAILGEFRAVTSPLPGTTRDPVEACFLFNGFPIRLVDTAGIESDESDHLAGEGRSLARRLIKRADVEVRLVNDEEGLIEGQAQAFGGEGPAGIVRIRNKCDLPSARCDGDDAKEGENGREPLAVSALLGTGLEQLLDRIGSLLGLHDLERMREPTLFTRRQFLLVERALAAKETGRDCLAERDALICYLGESGQAP